MSHIAELALVLGRRIQNKKIIWDIFPHLLTSLPTIHNILYQIMQIKHSTVGTESTVVACGT